MTKNRFVLLSAAALLLLAAVSCDRKVHEGTPTIPYVREILGSRDSREMGLLRMSEAALRSADIAVIGDEKACIAYADRFDYVDSRDNVDGRREFDGLADFSGECIACVADTVPYSAYLEANGAEAMRTQTVRRVLAAIDTTLHISPYDLDGLSTKPSSKIVILADPYLVQYGQFDVDTLFRSSGCAVDLVSPVDLMYSRVFEAFPGKKVHVAVICDSTYISSSLYQTRFRDVSIKYGALGSSIMPVAASTDSMFVRSVLEKFMNSGHTATLDAIIVDSFDVDVSELKHQLADAISIMNESSMVYGKLVSKGFMFVDAFETVSSACYDLLRSRNMFTHNISAPSLSFYRPVPRPDASDGSIMLIPGTYVQN